MSISEQKRAQRRAAWAGRYAALQQVYQEGINGRVGSPRRPNRQTALDAPPACLGAAAHGRALAGQPA